jgi:transposase
MDNYVTHKTDRVQRWLARHPRFYTHFTPTYSSWLNLVERFFAFLTERCIKRGVHCSTWALEQDIRGYLDQHNAEAKPFIWTKTSDQILDSVRRFCTRLLDVHASGVRARTSGTGH